MLEKHVPLKPLRVYGLSFLELSGVYKNMDNEQREEHILKLMIATFNFKPTKSGKFFVCQFCGKRLMKNYIGKGLNERMIEHYTQYHSGK